MPHKTKSKKTGDLKKMKVLRYRDPKKKTSGTRTKDGEQFKGGKNVKGRPKVKKKNLICKQMGKATVCFDKSRPKRSDNKKVQHKKK